MSDNKRSLPESEDNDSSAANAKPFELDLRSDSLSGEEETVRIVTEEPGALNVLGDWPINACVLSDCVVNKRNYLNVGENAALDDRGGEGRLGLENDEGVINNIEPEYGLLRRLVVHKVLNDQNVKFISIDKRDHYEQSRRLLALITKDNLENFKEALRASKQEHVAAFIEDKLAAERQTRRSPELSILTEDDRQSINNNHDKLVENISSNELLDELYANSCITEQHLISIRSKTANPKRNEEMLDIIKRRSKRDFDKFKEILFKSHGYLRELYLLTTKTTSSQSMSEHASKEILKEIKSLNRSSTFNIIDVNFEEKNVELRYCLKPGFSTSNNDLPAFEEHLRQICMPHCFSFSVIPIADIPFCQLTRKGGLGSSIASMNQNYAIRGRLACCAGALVDIGEIGVHIVTTAHHLSVDDDIWFNSDANFEINSRGILGRVKECLLAHEFEDYPETTDAALIKLNTDRDLRDYFSTTVNIAGEEKGMSYDVEEAEMRRIVVKVCNQELLLKGKIVKTNYSRLHETEFYRCIVIEHDSENGSESFHLQGESGMLIAYEASPPFHNKLIGVGMLIARYLENQKWFSVAVPLQRTMNRLKECGYVGGRSISVVPSLYFNKETHTFDVPGCLLTGPEFNTRRTDCFT